MVRGNTWNRKGSSPISGGRSFRSEQQPPRSKGGYSAIRVLFVSVIDPSKPIQKAYYPLSFGYLKSYAAQNGVRFDSRFAEVGGFTGNLYDVLGSFRPSVVAMTAITENWERAIGVAQGVRRFAPYAKIAVGGPHISAVPLSLSRDMDVGVIGEGEQTFLELLRSKFRTPEGTDAINGTVFHTPSGKIHVAPPRKLIEPLDAIPFPDRTVFPFPPRKTYVFTSRGCPYRCVFCSSSRFWGRVRFHSPQYTAAEIAKLADKGVKEIAIFDDCFVLDMDRVKKIRDLVAGLGVRFTIAARANLVTDEVADVLASMNVEAVGMGLESNSLRVLEWLNKGNTPEINQQAVDTLRRHGLRVHASFIRGTPIETKADLSATYAFIKKNKLSFDMYRLMPYPNTPLWDGSNDWGQCRVKYFGGRPLARRVLDWGKRKALSIIRGTV